MTVKEISLYDCFFFFEIDSLNSHKQKRPCTYELHRDTFYIASIEIRFSNLIQP